VDISITACSLYLGKVIGARLIKIEASNEIEAELGSKIGDPGEIVARRDK